MANSHQSYYRLHKGTVVGFFPQIIGGITVKQLREIIERVSHHKNRSPEGSVIEKRVGAPILIADGNLIPLHPFARKLAEDLGAVFSPEKAMIPLA